MWEEAVDLETGAVMAPEELGDAQTMGGTLRMAREEVKAFGSGAKVQEVVTATFLNKWKGRDRVEQTVSDWSVIVEPSVTMLLEGKFPYVQPRLFITQT